MDLPAIFRRAVALITSPAAAWEAIVRASSAAPLADEGLADRLEAQEPPAPAPVPPRPSSPHLSHLAAMLAVALAAQLLFVILLKLRLGPFPFLGRLFSLPLATALLLAAGVWVLSRAARALAPPLESRPDPAACLTLAIYGTTPTFLAALLVVGDGIFVTVAWHRLAVLLGAAGTIWCLYHGVGPVLGTPPPRRALFAGTLGFLWLVLSAIAFVGPRQLS